jgi:putative tricarboxylic transport membrane protein
VGPDVVSGLALGGLAVFAWVGARGLAFGTLTQPGPGFFPRSLAALTGALAAALVVRGGLAPASPLAALWPERAGVRRVLVMLAALFGYAAALEPLGYLLATLGLFLVLLRGVGRRSWPVTGLVAVLAAAGSYLLFARWLMVSLPAGLWAP